MGIFDKVELQSPDAPLSQERRTSKVIATFAHGEGLVLLAEPSVALEFVREFGSAVSPEGAFNIEDCAVSLATPIPEGVCVGELHVVDGGPESYEMPHIRDYYAEIHKLRPIEANDWRAHLAGEWPDGWNEPSETVKK